MSLLMMKINYLKQKHMHAGGGGGGGGGSGGKLGQKLAKGKGRKGYFKKPGSNSWNKWQLAGVNFNQPSVSNVGVDTQRHISGMSIVSPQLQGASQSSVSQLGALFPLW